MIEEQVGNLSGKLAETRFFLLSSNAVITNHPGQQKQRNNYLGI